MRKKRNAEERAKRRERRVDRVAGPYYRWSYSALLLFFIYRAYDQYSWYGPHSGSYHSAVVIVVLYVLIVGNSWRLWWRRKYPEGARLVPRFWGRMDVPPVSLSSREADEQTWPPPPTRP